MRLEKLWCGAAVAAIAVAGISGTAIATVDEDLDDTIEMPAPESQNAEIDATLTAVAAELSE